MTIIKKIIAFLFSLLFIFILLFVTHGHSNELSNINIYQKNFYFFTAIKLEDNGKNNTVVIKSKLKHFLPEK